MKPEWPSDYQRLYGAPLSEPIKAQELLRDPVKQWKKGRSAYEAAHAWIGSHGSRGVGLPARVRAVVQSAPEWSEASVVTGFFEHATALDTQVGPSNTDILVVCGLKAGLGILAVEAKAGESFGPRVCDWQTVDPSPGKSSRWAWACEFFNVDPAQCSDLRWQLFHRTASAVIEAQRFRSAHAMMLVHDFSPDASCLDDYLLFASAIGLTGARRDGVSDARTFGGVSLRLAWTTDQPTA